VEILGLLMVASILICAVFSIVSIGFSAGIFQHQTLVIDALRERLEELTGLTAEKYVKSLPVRVRVRARMSHDGPVQTIRNGIRMLRGRPLLLTNKRWIETLDALRTGPWLYMTEDRRQRLLEVALYCASLSIKRPPIGPVNAAAFNGQRQAEILFSQVRHRIRRAQSVDDLIVVYLEHRTMVRGKWFHSVTGGRRKILRAIATPQWIFWKRFLVYVGGAGGVGSIFSLCLMGLGYREGGIAGWLPVVGGGVGAFLCAVGIVKTIHRGPLPDGYRTAYRLFIKRQPLVGTGLMSGQIVLMMCASVLMVLLVMLALAVTTSFTLGLTLGVLAL